MRSAALLHLVDADGPGAGLALARLACGHAGDAPVVALGSRPVPGCEARIPVPAGSVRLAAAALERLVDAADAQGVVAWGMRACQVACAARDAAHRTLVMDGVPHVGAMPFDADVVCLADAIADRATRAGWPPMRIRVVAPPVPVFAEPDESGAARAAWRASRGVPAEACVVGLMPAAPDAGDALVALHAVGRVRMAGADARLLLDPRAGKAGAMQAFARSIGMRHAVIFEPQVRQPERVAAAVDAWISLPGTGVDGTALDACVAAGLHAPVVVSRGSFAAEACIDGADAIVVEPPNGVASALLGLMDHPARRRELAVASRTRHASQAVRQVFAGLLADVAARASMRAASDAAAPA